MMNTVRRRRALTTAVAVAVTSAILTVACTSDRDSTPEPSSPGDTPAASTSPIGSSPAPGRPGTSATTPPGGSTDVPREVVDGFDDHTVSRLESTDDFFALARAGVGGQQVVKFAIPSMQTSDDVRWFDSNFYELHDEWYWFRLLNGRTVPGFDVEPVDAGPFASVAEVVAWAERRAELPLDLRFLDSVVRGQRLYSPAFYRDALPNDRRNYGLGAVIWLPDAADGDDHWLMELGFGDTPDAATIDRYFELLEATLPAEIGRSLEWVIRSPAQETAARDMEASGALGRDRIVRFGELVPPGETAVYQPGVAAGRLLVVDGVDARLTDATSTDIVIIEQAPDWLPPAAALITSDPQTPLAHVNLLARNRGIPNASVQGVLDDPGLRQAARVRAHAVVRAAADGTLEVALISRDEYDRWTGLATPSPVAVPAVDPFSMPTTVDLTDLARTVTSEADVDEWRPVIGGKAAGFLHLLGTDGVELPPNPIAITVAPYLRHQAQVREELDAMMADPEFQSSAAVRFLYLEGEDDFRETYPDDDHLADRLLAQHDPATPLGRVLHGGGFQRLWRDVAMDRDDLAAITAAVRAANADLDPDQGIRFRSSSSVEDIEGFTGAGLYDSNTGFFDPVSAGEDDDRTFETAIVRTWASYWSFEAFEERHRERISHISGEMAVLVHARFDDDLERANGVVTSSLLPDGGVVVTINSQVGAESVTNPDGDAPGSPEVVVAERAVGEDWSIDRVASSTLADGDVLTDADVVDLADRVADVTRTWMDRVNVDLPQRERVRTLTLDLEFKLVAAGWPTLLDGELPGRLIVKQARSLEPGLRRIPDDVRTLPIPRDVLSRARLVRDTCGTVEVFTDPLVQPDVGYSESPLVITVDGGEACSPSTLYASPNEYLVELLAGDVTFVLAP